jgi:arylsulfatase A-like enzyme
MANPRPNFLVVIFDALRASDFPGGSTPAGDMPLTQQIVDSGIRFPRAASVTPWTIPAHASAFTGLYPWEHGCHAKNNLMLSSGVERLPQTLRPLGYRSIMLSANTLVCPRFGLSEGFDSSGWGSWIEPYVRRVQTDSPPSSLESVGVGSGKFLDRVREGPIGQIILQNTQALYRYPFVFDLLDLTQQHLKFPGNGRDLSVSPWIEPSLQRWISAQPREDPVLCVLNLVDTHEPYFVPEGWANGVGFWWKKAKVRQDFVKCISGSWSPSAKELSVLRELCRASVRHLEQRLRSIIRIFENAGRWANTSVFLTSDHGQAFGEHGELFHLNGVIDPMLRIPLVYRPANGTVPSHVGKGWASLIDIAPTVLRELELPDGRYASAFPLQDLATSERPFPLFAVSDGLVWNHLKRVVPESRKTEFDRVRVVAYEGKWKLVFDATQGRTQLYDIESDPSEDHDLWPTQAAAVPSLAQQAGDIARKMVAVPVSPLSPEIENRLKSWGYV